MRRRSSTQRPTQFERRAAYREQRRKIILACEGKETEPRYFEDMQRTERLDVTFNIVIALHQGTNPLNVVTAAISAREEEQRKKLWKQDDAVWAIYDGDEHLQNNREDWHRALDKARGNDINLAISNPCFELWFLLHFEDCFNAVDRVVARRKLETHIRDYTKSLSVYVPHLQPHTKTAIARAAKIAAFARNTGKQPHENPCTGMGNLIAVLLGLTEP